MFRFGKLVLAASLLAFSVQYAHAQGMSYSYGGYPPGSRLDPAVNVYLSRVYDHLLQTSWGFRMYRTRKECRPINIPQLRAECVASFDQYEPFVGWRPYWY